MRHARSLFALALATTTIALVACTAEDPSASAAGSDLANGDKSPSGGPAASGGSGDSTGSTVPSSTAPAKTPGIGPCATKASALECSTCCAATSPETQAAAKKDHDSSVKWQTCACAATVCGDVCKTDYCAAGFDPDNDAKDGSACAECLDGDKTDACDDQTEAEDDANEATPGYEAWDKCEEDAKCEQLPGGDGDDDDDDDDDDDKAPTPSK